jgi:biopolymer transport protein ExbB/TolQ
MEFVSMASTYFKTGGPFMYVILVTAVLSLGLILERFWVIGRASSFNAGRFVADLETLIVGGKADKAVQLARGIHTPPGKVAHAMLTAGSVTAEERERVGEGAAALALAPLGRRLNHLTLLANVATLLGLLGTVFGLTTAFSAVGAADPSQRSAFLAAGISQALNTTSLGLMVGVPTLVCHGFLVAAVEKVADQVDEVSVSLTRAISELARRQHREAA